MAGAQVYPDGVGRNPTPWDKSQKKRISAPCLIRDVRIDDTGSNTPRPSPFRRCVDHPPETGVQIWPLAVGALNYCPSVFLDGPRQRPVLSAVGMTLGNAICARIVSATSGAFTICLYSTRRFPLPVAFTTTVP